MENLKFKRLRTIHIAYFLVSLIICALFSWFLYLTGTQLIEKFYLKPTAVESRRLAYEDSFEDYVDDNNLSSMDYYKMSTWIKQNPDVYLFLIDEEGFVVYESGHWSETDPVYLDETVMEEVRGFDDEVLETTIAYPVRDIQFTDGNFMLYVSESTEVFWYNLIKMGSIGFGILMFMLLQILFTNKIIRKVKRLSDEVTQIECGNINYPVTKEGCSELTQLAYHVDSMRFSLVDQMKREQEVVKTNYDLVSELSHDVRTPLTALIGYMEVLDEHPELSEEKKRDYISRSKDKTLQLKLITDKMFQYSFNFNEGFMDTNTLEYELMVLLPQLIYERVFDLQANDFEVTVNLEETDKMIRVDVQYLHRLFDNLFSNINRYSLKEGVIITGLARDESYVLEFENFKDIAKMNSKSTNIGLKTCANVMQQLGGDFEVHQTASKFIVTVTIPVEDKI